MNKKLIIPILIIAAIGIGYLIGMRGNPAISPPPNQSVYSPPSSNEHKGDEPTQAKIPGAQHIHALVYDADGNLLLGGHGGPFKSIDGGKTWQKVATKGAKQSIASFKVREGDTVGMQVTLRGARMFDFIDKLIHIALPRTRDFRGLSVTSIDDMGNLTIGLKEHTIFPETSDEDLKDVFGLAVTVVTTATSKTEAEAFFRHLGVPLRSDIVAK